MRLFGRILLAGLVTLALIVAFFAFWPFQRTVIIVNASGSQLEGGDLEMAGRRFSLPPLKPEQRFSVSYTVRGEGDYHLTVRHEARTQEARLGYIQSPLFAPGGPDILVVMPTSLFQATPYLPPYEAR